MSYVIELVCDACGAARAADEPALLCPRCGGLLDARYDYPAIARSVAPDDLARRRANVWRWRELLPVRDPRFFVDIGAGGSPLIECPRLAEWVGARRLWVKYDGAQPTASLKDRSFAVAMGKAAELGVRGALTYSSGNAAASFTAHAAKLGLPARVLVNAWADTSKLALARGFGVPIILLQWSRFTEVEDLMRFAAMELGWYTFVNFQNPWRHEGSKTAAFEVWWDLGRAAPDHQIHPIGTGGGIFGALKAYGELKALGWSERVPRLHGTQPAACAALVEAHVRGEPAAVATGDPSATIAESIATDVPFDAGRRPLRAARETGGSIVAVSDDDMLDGIRRLGREGISAEPAGASTVWAARTLAERGVIRPDHTVVLSVTASGLKQTSALLKAAGDAAMPVIDTTPAALAAALAGP